MHLFTSAKKAQIIKQWKNQKKVQEIPEKRENFIVSTWKSFAENTSIHGVHYLTQKSITLMEKFLWALSIILATFGMIYCCNLLSIRFRTSLISTVFESTTWPVTEIPFPAISICNNNRLNYSKTNEAIEKFYVNQSKEDTTTFVTFIRVLQNMDYGSFDEFNVINDKNVTAIDKSKVSEIYQFLMHDCHQFFIQCSWRKKPFNCCDWFTKQRTEYGICWSFNSFSSEQTKFIDKTSTNFPWRIANHGMKSGLKLLLNTHPNTSINRLDITNSNPGIFAIIQHPHEFPSNGNFVGAGSRTSLGINPTLFSTSNDVRSLSPVDRQCYYEVTNDINFKLLCLI